MWQTIKGRFWEHYMTRQIQDILNFKAQSASYEIEMKQNKTETIQHMIETLNGKYKKGNLTVKQSM